MKHAWAVAASLLLLAACGMQAPARKAAAPTLDQPAERVLRTEAVVHADAKQVWRAFSTAQGASQWMAPVVALDFRTGGSMRTHYDPGLPIGAPGTIRLDILNVIENELVTYKVNLTERFPTKVRAEDQHLQEIVQLLPMRDGDTRVVATMVGWGNGPEWDETYAFFEKGNAYTMDRLVEMFERPRR